jgi:hypothetical protein
VNFSGREVVDVLANQQLTVELVNPNLTGVTTRVIVGAPGEGQSILFGEQFGGFISPIDSVSRTFGSFGYTPIQYRVLLEVPGDLGINVFFRTRGPVVVPEAR